MKIISTALMALGLLLLSGCTPQPATVESTTKPTDELTAKTKLTAPVTVDYLAGNWRTIQGNAYAQFNLDGTYRIARSIEGLKDSPVEEGQYTLEGTLFTFISSDESRNCAAGQRGVYEIERTGEDEMRMVRQEDECGNRSLPFVDHVRVP